MFLTAKVHYAVMALLALEDPEEGGKKIKRTSIALSQGLDPGYLDPIMTSMRRRGLVAASNGPGGGYSLLKSRSQISLYDIIETVGEKIKITRCGDNALGCRKDGQQCSAHKIWKDLENHIKDYMLNTSLADIAAAAGCNSLLTGEAGVKK